MRRLVLLTNTPTPYRLAFLDVLHDELAGRGASLAVAYCAEREPHRHWQVDLATQRFEWKILAGVHPRVGPAIAHLNPGIVPLLVRWRPDWLLVAGAWNTPTMLLATAAARGRCPRIFWSEGHADAVLHPEGPIARLRRRVLSAFDAFAVPNRKSAAFLEAELGRPVTALPLPNCVDEGYFGAPREASPAALRAELGLDPARRLVLVVGQAVDRKGGDRLLEGYAALDPAGRAGLALAFVGSGPRLAAWSARAREIPGGTVTFLGERGQAEVRRLLWAADAFALPSLVDPNPLSAIEAAFAGLPLLLSSRLGNAGELVRPGETGLLFDPLDPTSVRDALAAFAALPAARLPELGRAARATAEAGFARRSVARAFCDRLLSLHNGPRDAP